MNNKFLKKTIFFLIFCNQVKSFKIFNQEINKKLIFIFGSVYFAGFAFKKFKDKKRKIESLEKELSILNLDINKKNLNINIIEKNKDLLINKIINSKKLLFDAKKYLDEKDYEILNLEKSLNTEMDKNINNEVELNSITNNIKILESKIKNLNSYIFKIDKLLYL